MSKDVTPFQFAFIFISLLIVAPPIFYLVAVVGGTYYQNLVVLFLFLAMAIIAPFMVAAHILAVKSPLLLIGIDVLFALGIYYFVNIWTPYSAHDELVYQDDLELFGNVKIYEEEHYALSGSLDNPRKGGTLQHAIVVSFNEHGHKIKEEKTYRRSPLKRPGTGTKIYVYNSENQLIRENDRISYTYDEEGQLWKILEEYTSYYKNQRTDNRIETIYTHDELLNTLIEEENKRWIRHYPNSFDTSYHQTARKKIFNENQQLLYEGDLKEGVFLYDVKCEYNDAKQLIAKREISYNEKETTYTYDALGHLKEESSISFRGDKTKPESSESIQYDTLGHKIYENFIWYYYEPNHPYAPKSERELFAENEYDSFQNLIRKTIFIKEGDEQKRPYYLVEIELIYWR